MGTIARKSILSDSPTISSAQYMTATCHQKAGSISGPPSAPAAVEAGTGPTDAAEALRAAEQGQV
jgi:hypothetical protein